MTFIILLLLIVVALVAASVVMYNGLVKQRNTVQEAWHQIDVELTRRHDLIPNLVEAVKGYAKHEGDTLDAVIRARGAAVNTHGSPENAGHAAAAEDQLSSALGRLISVSEAYPDLKSNQNYQQLMGELSSAEDRIAGSRRYYNACVRELNSKIDSVPTKFFAGPAGATKAQYYQADESTKGAPRINMSDASAPSVNFEAPQSQHNPYGELPATPANPYPTQQGQTEGYGVNYPGNR